MRMTSTERTRIWRLNNPERASAIAARSTKRWRSRNPDKRRKINKASHKKLAIRNQKFVYNYLLNNPCVDCGESDLRCLEFDHLRDKKELVSRLSYGGSSIDRIIEEINKCEVRCANCHKRKHRVNLLCDEYV